LTATGLACGWPGREPVLRAFDLELTVGRTVAVVGPSGLGKTTLLLTLAGLLPPAAGRVVVDGVAIGSLGRAQAAQHVTMTAEDAHVFDTTVLENLRVARGDVTPAEALQVLQAVGLGSWLAGLPAGLDTELGTDAARISGGERRRLLVARALMSPAPVLLLDEPTEHLDAGAADLLTALLDGTLAPGRAVVVVTHRLDGVQAADEVILLDSTGSVRARGPHDALLDGPGSVATYRAAWTAQQQETS
ncbi:MAG: ATP-binding cassette domain-containing protein, partial [Cellulomonadaceae bacterium]|nr:ATP-binding cassette domain-containing protein [Cellulomonadaceae bacterium]